MQRTFTASDPENHSEAIVTFIPADAKLIRVDGHSGVGKSRLAKMLAKSLPATRIDVDSFLNSEVPGRAYLPKIRLDKLRGATEIAIQQGRTVLDGLWLEHIFPESRYGRGFRICVVSQAHGKSDGHRDELNRRRQFKTDQYFRDYRPDEAADLLLIVPHIPF